MPFPITLEQVSETEARMGVTFPRGFVDRMLPDNGGEVTIEDKRANGHTSRKPASRLATNGLGDHLVLLPDPSQPRVLLAAVFMWSHESGELDKVANDFAELG